VYYCFAGLADDGTIQHLDKWADIEVNNSFGEATGNLGELYKLKCAYRHVKTVLSIGGWNNSDKFSSVFEQESTADNFVQSCLHFLRLYHLDGIDIDWEYPGKFGKEHSRDISNLIRAIKKLHKAFSVIKPHPQISLAVPSHNTDWKFRELSQYVDSVNVMAYDFTDPRWSPLAFHHSNLCGEHLNVDSVIKEYMKRGCPLEKLVLGIPMYGKRFKDCNALKTNTFRKEIGDIPYNTIDSNNYTIDYESNAVYRKDGMDIVVFDNVSTVIAKCRYLIENNLG
jgi:chitinase